MLTEALSEPLANGMQLIKLRCIFQENWLKRLILPHSKFIPITLLRMLMIFIGGEKH